MLIKEIMNRSVRTITENETVKEAAKKMSEPGIGCLIVTRDGNLAGIVTERDIIRKVVAKSLDVSKTKVRDVMSRNVIMIDPDTDIEDAVDVMMEKKIKKLPVVKDDKLIGIVTATDICAIEPKLAERLSSLIVLGKKKLIAG